MFASLTTQPRSGHAGVGFGSIGARFKRWADDRAVRRRLERELQSHSDRDLAELGMSRSDIPDVIRGTFRA